MFTLAKFLPTKDGYKDLNVYVMTRAELEAEIGLHKEYAEDLEIKYQQMMTAGQDREQPVTWQDMSEEQVIELYEARNRLVVSFLSRPLEGIWYVRVVPTAYLIWHMSHVGLDELDDTSTAKVSYAEVLTRAGVLV